ncbi:exodeoxyribonuclease [Alphaproteobacteria bacterium]|nr:exodeoxyribonuclease [Alphaproteobacteria bacterium]GHS99314.1 exodeoxyribonuclease [Alphaproteobacteria bacterium]
MTVLVLQKASVPVQEPKALIKSDKIHPWSLAVTEDGKKQKSQGLEIHDVLMIFISLNVNGLRAALCKGMADFFAASQPDFILLQEIKVDVPMDLALPEYSSEWNFSGQSGYAGTAILFKRKPLKVKQDFYDTNFNGEGRLITLEYPSFFVVNVYVPNSQGPLKRWYYRLDWDSALLDHLSHLCLQKPVLVGGDFNVAHHDRDIYPENTKNIEKQPGFREEERGAFDALLELGFIDTFRFLRADEGGAYTWWSGKYENRRNNRGRRIDYFLVSKSLETKIQESSIFSNVTISDHAPIKLMIEL